jgi:hypothetical protein
MYGDNLQAGFTYIKKDAVKWFIFARWRYTILKRFPYITTLVLSSVQKWHLIPNGIITLSFIVQFYKKRMNTCAQMQEDLLKNLSPVIVIDIIR